MKKAIAVGLLAMLAAPVVVADSSAEQQNVETWDCKEFGKHNWEEKPVLVKASSILLRDSDIASLPNELKLDNLFKELKERKVRPGFVVVAGTSHNALYSVQGFNRRWDFGPSDRPGNYAFIIEPDGTGLYYEFMNKNSLAKARQVLTCRLAESDSSATD